MKGRRYAVKDVVLPAVVRRMFPQATTIEDGTERLNVAVTSRDGGPRAKVGDPAHCAMARACERTLHADGAFITLSRSYVLFGKRLVRYQTPSAVAREVISFDRRAGFQPGAYYLRPVAKGNALLAGHKNPEGRGPERKRPQGRYVRHMTTNVRSLRPRAGNHRAA